MVITTISIHNSFRDTEGRHLFCHLSH